MVLNEELEILKAAKSSLSSTQVPSDLHNDQNGVFAFQIDDKNYGIIWNEQRIVMAEYVGFPTEQIYHIVRH